jgi:homoserine kinase
MSAAFADKLHQPYRGKLVPFLENVIAAAQGAGALGAFLSGSGSAIAAVTFSNVKAIAAAMRKAAESQGAKLLITSADNRGARTIK